jgi:hypothetical protein
MTKPATSVSDLSADRLTRVERLLRRRLVFDRSIPRCDAREEAPKALVIVPWKSSEIGDPLGLDKNLDGSRRPVDKEVFMRELDYYDIRTGSK